MRRACLNALASLRNDGTFTAPWERGLLIVPSNIGGAYWGGVAYDPTALLIVVPTNRIGAVITLIPRDSAEAARAGDSVEGERLGLEYAPMHGSPYVLQREMFAANGRPCTPPPYGTLQAIDLATGKTVWNVPLGTGEGLPFGETDGMVNLGGPIITASGLVFIGAAPDRYFRAFDERDGREQWKNGSPPARGRRR